MSANVLHTGSASVTFTMDDAALTRYAYDPSGPVVADLIRRGRRVQGAAALQVGTKSRYGSHFGFGHVGGEEFGRPNLRDTITTRVVIGYAVPFVRVGSTSPIALLHHEGTRPHTIVPVRARLLRFYSQRSGGVVYTRIVRHPGTRPNRYLTDNLRLAVRKV